ncbi:hypothetical protein SBRY_20039 [Actinacidiphila bryophytorum]|uniref:Uncharacterized protein n=1 Tax=Actinacidiphila bryophytorum TaxID=1436133 RepID=A0A9W4GZ98_9ACTN|nr:hypothetical protein SBRY_20039 [Actinacidiphila bryophytorum]
MGAPPGKALGEGWSRRSPRPCVLGPAEEAPTRRQARPRAPGGGTREGAKVGGWVMWWRCWGRGWPRGSW